MKQSSALGRDPESACEFAIELTGLSKIYRAQPGAAAVHALKSVDLKIPAGSFFGILGPNGAGKSTLINILAGLVVKSSGRASVWGYDIDQNPRNAKASIGVVPQEVYVDAFFTPREMMEFQAGLYAVPKAKRNIDEIFEALSLTDKANSYARTLSGGMKRRLLVAKAMVHAPPVLVLDEPTAGVDIELRRQLWEYVVELNKRGTTVVLTTHYLEEAEALCDQIAIINKGEVVACDETRALIRRIEEKQVVIKVDREITALPAALASHDAKLHGPRGLAVRYRPSQVRVEDILSAVRAEGLSIIDLSTEEADLEDVFLQLTRQS
ncbi:MAG: ABC transporter ATP-binding protein [Sphingomonadales bacterium]